MKNEDTLYLQFYECDYPHTKGGIPPEMSSMEMIPYQAGDWVKREDVKKAMGAIAKERQEWLGRWALLSRLLDGYEYELEVDGDE